MYFFQKKWEWENTYFNIDNAYKIEFQPYENINIRFSPETKISINNDTCSTYMQIKAYLENQIK